MYGERYIEQVKLLLQCLPVLREQEHLALKGGTPINLFLRPLPRLSVDIDVQCTVIRSREETFALLKHTFEAMQAQIERVVPNAAVRMQSNLNDELKLIVTNPKSNVKIETSYVHRGIVLPLEHAALENTVSQEFDVHLDLIPMLAKEEIYAGKLCATLNRQHPRDLFDTMWLLENEGISDLLRSVFVVYLACDRRPINELLNPNKKSIKKVFDKEFKSMTKESIGVDQLEPVLERLVNTLREALTDNERAFLLSVKEGEPDYALMPFENIANLPALQWKLLNIKKMTASKHALMLDKLKKVLSL